MERAFGLRFRQLGRHNDSQVVILIEVPGVLTKQLGENSLLRSGASDTFGILRLSLIPQAGHGIAQDDKIQA